MNFARKHNNIIVNLGEVVVLRLFKHTGAQVAIVVIYLLLTACAQDKGKQGGEEQHIGNEDTNDMTGVEIPRLTIEEPAVAVEKEIGSCTTPIINRQPSRVNNIRVASQVLDGMTIEPGEEFSFNEALGKRTKEKGYKTAPIFIKKRGGTSDGYGVGGGICQVSSTLYGAALEANLNVTERHPHSKRVKYVKPGRDATVVYGGADLKFVNTRENPITIKTKLENDQLTIIILEKFE
jgi:vancomycin resistance protein YoaR